jgi:FkbM family methyltransferase
MNRELIVQIGANRGNDHVTEYVKSLLVPPQLILIEPIPLVLEELKQCYAFLPDVKIFQCAIIPDSSTVSHVSIYYATRTTNGYETNYEVSSINKEHTVKLGAGGDESQVIELVVPAKSINDILIQERCKVVDVLYIDAEGMDFDIVRSINFELFDIKRIRLETHHLLSDDVVKFMKGHGYINQSAVNLDMEFWK